MNRVVARGLSVLVVLCVATTSRSATVEAAEPIQLTKNTVARPATPEEAKKILTARDTFVQNLSPFDRAARLKSDKPVTEKQLLDTIADQIRPYAESEWKNVAAAIRTIAEQLKGYDVRLPKDVLFIKVTGKVCSGAAYTRGNAIVLPQSRLGAGAKALERLVAHELFHVLSRNDPDLRKKLYAIVSFTPIDEPKLPEWLAARKLTNPDAPTLGCYATLKVDEEDIPVVPVLYSREATYDTRRGGSFFSYMNFALMEIRRAGDAWEAVTNDEGRPKFYSPRDVPDYFNKIGRNTGYIIHPEEVLADNFTYLLSGKKNLPTPRIVDEMRKVMRVSDEKAAVPEPKR